MNLSSSRLSSSRLSSSLLFLAGLITLGSTGHLGCTANETDAGDGDGGGGPSTGGVFTGTGATGGMTGSETGGAGPAAGGSSVGAGGGNGAGGNAPGAACGFNNQGEVLDVAANIQLCLPPTVCVPETCPPELGDCVDGKCVYKGGYQGLSTLPEAWATQYCDLQAGTCNGVSQFQTPLQTATQIAGSKGYPLCSAASAGETCVGIVASPPMMVGNSEVTKDPATGDYAALWGLGMTEATGLCYEIQGPGGSALVAVTDRCAGYCRCDGKETYEECGACVNSADLHPKCPCVAPVPPIYDACCVRGEPIVCESRPADDTLPQCDWCASNNHPHFDVDDATFAHICGDEAIKGSCQLSVAKFVPCATPHPEWPPNR